jgi:hypothetical protein
LPFELHIRHNLETGADHFAAGEVRSFDQNAVRVGRHPECECRLDAPDFAPVQFHLLLDGAGGNARLRPEPGRECFVNEQTVTGEIPLQSGDEIRVGHWTLHFQRVFARAQQARKCDVLAVAARIMVAMILIFELGIVLWLPWALKSARAWEAEIAGLRVAMLLDHLRAGVAKADANDELTAAAWRTIEHELDGLARFVREHDNRLNRDQLQGILNDLNALDGIRQRLENGTAFPAIPTVDVDGGVRAAIGLVSP